MDEALERARSRDGAASQGAGHSLIRQDLIILLVAAAIFAGCMFAPPHLMDDVDSVQATIARNMLHSGDWVSARLNGVLYLEKAPLPYWLMAASFAALGVADWVARIWLVAGILALCLLTGRFARWAFGPNAGLCAGLALATSAGLFLFTRILIPDALLTLAIALALWGFLRALEEDEPHPRRWALLMAASLGAGVLLKGLIGVVFPLGIAFFYLLLTRQLFARRAWQRLHPFLGLTVLLAVALPWHVLAILRNPPYFDLTWGSEPGHWRGFFWFYFLNEHVFRFLDMRHPRDHDTVPRLYFWLLQLVWLFPWSVYLPAAARLGFKPLAVLKADRAGRVILLCLIWIAVVMLFFTFSTTQEYYSMPIYPAAAMLVAAALVQGGSWVRAGTRVLLGIAVAAVAALVALGFYVRDLPTPGDISRALTHNPELYTLSMGHMADLTLPAFAYLRLPLVMALAAFAGMALALWRLRGARAVLGVALSMVLFFHAARVAMIEFDPYLSSRSLARALAAAPPGTLILDDQFYTFSSVIFYTGRSALLWNGRVNNLEYGSYAPGAPDVFPGDARVLALWDGSERMYLVAYGSELERIADVMGEERGLYLVRESGGKYLFTNHPLAAQGDGAGAAKGHLSRE